MNLITTQALKDSLCATFCRDLTVRDGGDSVAVSLPIVGRDGDHLTAYVSPITGGWRVSDKGTTLMRLSYEHDLAKLLSGARERLFQTVLQENGLQEDDGELFVEVAADALSIGLFSLGQGATRIEDIGLWTGGRVQSTFVEDLRSALVEAAGIENVVQDYEVPDLPAAQNYLVDFFVRTPGLPLYVFGVTNRANARLATIILQYLQAHSARFDSMIVYSDMDEVPKADVRRLMMAANDSVPSIHERGGIKAKVKHRTAA